MLVVASVIAGLLGLVAVRLVQLTAAESPNLQRLALRQHRERLQVSAHRGAIVDRHGETLAASVERPSIFIRPRRVAQPARLKLELAGALSLTPQAVESRLASTAPFVWVKRAVTPRERDAVVALKLEGVGEVIEARRFYPHESAGAHVLGLTGVDLQGLEGIERYYESDLRASPRTLEVERDAFGREIFVDGMEDPRAMAGATIQLTLDIVLQDMVERALEHGVSAARGRAGTAIVLDPWTGEILALANTPGFDPNDRASTTAPGRRNRAVSDFYEPGSTFKALLAAAALEHGIVQPNEMIFCENGRFPVGKWIINDHHPQGWLSVAEIVQVSSNIGAAKIGERLGKERFYEFLAGFEFGQPTGIDLPGEVGGMLKPASAWSRIGLVTTSFGQGIALTPLQMARAFAAVANGGLLVKPYVGMRAVSADGGLLWEQRPQVLRRVMRPESARAVTAMLERVLEDGGTGAAARVEGFRVAGKTGTAQKVEAGTGRYSARGRIASFVGFLPAEEPRVVILTLIDEPETSPYGGVVAAPIFQTIAVAAMERLGLTVPTPQRRPGGYGPVPVSAAPADTAGGTPSFVGLSMRAALERARELGREVEFVGNGYVTSQLPSPGASAPPDQILRLELQPAGDSL